MTMYINLLPWREQKKTREIRRFNYYFVASFLSTVLIVLVIDGYLNHLIQRQTVLHQQLVKHQRSIDQTIEHMNEKKDRWMMRILKNKSIHQLYSKRDFITRVLKLLQQSITLDVVMSRIERHKNEMTLSCSTGSRRLRHTLANNASVLLVGKPVDCREKECEIRFKLRSK